MLPKEYGGVVDTTLTVYGTTNLRVVDSVSSIFEQCHFDCRSNLGLAWKVHHAASSLCPSYGSYLRSR